MAKRASCHGCVYAQWDRGVWLRGLGTGWPGGPTCGNQPELPGRMRECPHGGVCRNYRVRPPVPEGEGVKRMPLGDGVYAYVDGADFEWLNQWTWRVHGGYAARHEKRTVVFMHREIMKPPEGKIVDHVSGNKFDNTRANLRNITPQENQHNRRKQRGASSIYKGVTYYKAGRCWRAFLTCGKECYYLGQFDTEVEAARAYDYRAVEVFGEFARPNFPDQWPAERRRKVHAQWLREQARGAGKAV